MASIEELRKTRLEKLEKLKKAGIDPYPAKSNRNSDIGHLVSDFDKLSEKDNFTIAGRIMALRKHGGSVFIDLYDGTGKIQGYLKEDVLDKKTFALFNETVDIGDFVDISGNLAKTKRGEQSIVVTAWRMLTKSLRPLPEKWAGLKDTEERLRKRYLDILFNEEVKSMIEKKALFWQSTREFLMSKGFMEVETPALEATTGGADANPFVTHHDALDIDVYLRISAGELWQKRLMIAGFPKVFEIARIFRNEGMDAEHLQDYTQMEYYWAYADYEMGMDLTEELFKYVVQKTFGTLKFEINDHKVDLGKKWERYDYSEMVKKFTGVDILNTDIKEVEKKLKELGVYCDKDNLPRAIDALWKYCRKKISGPGFLIGTPKDLSPLSKTMPKNPNLTERFQAIIAGSELCNGYSELNDPVDQRERFESQQKMRDAGDKEAQMMDVDFVEALEYGMPPTCGLGFSERVFSFLLGKPVREQQIFPLMKPKDD